MISRLLTLLLAAIPILISAQVSYAELIDTYLARKSGYQSIQYHVALNRKSFSQIDTTYINADVHLTRIPSDTILKGLISIHVDSLWYGYDGQHIMEGNKLRSTLHVADAKSHPKIFIASTWVNDLVESAFMNGYADFKPRMLALEPYLTFSDTTIFGRKCKLLVYQFPDEQEFYDQKLLVAIDTASMMVVKRIYWSHFQGNEQYMEWTFRNAELLANGFDSDSITAIASSFSHVIEIQPDSANEELILSAYPFIELNGSRLNSNEKIQLRDDQSPLIILDFWYSACYPCIKSIPVIDRIALTYKDKGVSVYGVNLIDDEVKQASRILKFTEKNRMSYPTIMLRKESRASFPRIAYPTMVVLDKNREVIFTHVGFSETLFEDISAFLDARL